MKDKILFMCMMVAVLAAAGSAMATVVLPTGVDEYRIIFVTSGAFQATSTDIGWYNTMVSGEAGSNANLERLNVDWYCVGSTLTVDARDNISPGIDWNLENIPIYNTGGERVADNLADLFDATLQNAVTSDQHGVATLSTGRLWTGSLTSGTAYVPGQLGSDLVITGLSASNEYSWLCTHDTYPSSDYYSIYAISTTVPEPATVCLLGFGGLALLRRSRRQLNS